MKKRQGVEGEGMAARQQHSTYTECQLQTTHRQVTRGTTPSTAVALLSSHMGWGVGAEGCCAGGISVPRMISSPLKLSYIQPAKGQSKNS